eukprot:458320_1
MKLSQSLCIKIMDDKRKLRPWICPTCQFLNCKLMIDGLWRYYNQTNKCGLCGESRKQTPNATKKNRQLCKTYTSISKSKKAKPAIIDTEKWDEVDDSECTLFKSVKHLANNQLVYLLQNYFFNQITKKKLKEKLLE